MGEMKLTLKLDADGAKKALDELVNEFNDLRAAIANERRWWASQVAGAHRIALAAVDEAKRLENNAKQDADLLARYHAWCEKNNCAPSTSDLYGERHDRT